ncbi:MAG: tRNA (adenosine(37)-N6)-threonylcarbamoyltransferase complex ATPase subunit type 1 TsaE [Clostridia bacterium]
MEQIDNFFKNNITVSVISKSIDETINIGKYIAKYLSNNIVVLNGDLGCGKTLLTKGIISYFSDNKVTSPTFSIVNEYILDNINIYHFDVYRLKDSDEFIKTIGEDYFYNGLCIIEWGNIIKDILPKNSIYIDFEYIDEFTRKITLNEVKK